MTPGGAIGFFARHPTAANLLMLVVIVAGLVSIARNNTQFFPDFELDLVTVSVVWPGAAAADVDAGVVAALEPGLRAVAEVKKVSGTAREGAGWLVVEFHPGADLQAGLSEVENVVAQTTTLPEGAERPVVRRVVFHDTVARVVVSGAYPEAVLKARAKRIREALLARGVDRVTTFGARDEEILVEVAPEALLRLDATLDDIAAAIARSSRDLPAGGTAGASEFQIRGLGLRTDAAQLAEVEIRSGADGERILLGEVARVRDSFSAGQPTASVGGAPAVELHVQRAAGNDALELLKIVDDVLAELAPDLPPGMAVEQYDVAAKAIGDRINLLLRNGFGGLLLVMAVLLAFLDRAVALWVAVGIPVAVMAALATMLAAGQTINMVTLFALIMMLGIVVDDAIVVGEHAMARRRAGAGGLEAATAGARRMLAPVACASLTTVAMFMPVALVGGTIGRILFAIPVVAAAMLAASLVECFLILPGHMRGALARERARPGGWRRAFDDRFARFRDGPFRRLVALAVRWRYTTLAVAAASLVVCLGAIAGGRLQFVFFPSPESDTVIAGFAFAHGAPRSRSEAMVAELESALRRAEAALAPEGDSPVRLAVGKVGVDIGAPPGAAADAGDHLGGVQIELSPSERRDVRTADLIAAWRDEVRALPGLETLTIRERRGGPPGRDIDVRLSGDSVETLKAAALDLRRALAGYDGVHDVEDDLPWGKRELAVTVTPRGRALGFATESVARQLRAAFEGAVAMRFARGDEEVAVRVQLARADAGPEALRLFRLRGPGGAEVPLAHVAGIAETRGFAVIRREDGRREAAVTADVDTSVANPTELVAALAARDMPAIAAAHGVEYRFAGKAEEQGETLADMRLGALIGLCAVYVILAWVFASYARPFVVLAIIPFGLVGAVVGHLVLGFDLTILSLIGLLGLSGIAINDSIILVSTIDERMASGEAPGEAAVRGACDRLRAVTVTSLTTIGGLSPLLSETSLQAQFLKPMALTLVFGLMSTTLLVLFVAPALVAIQEDLARALRRRSRPPEARQEQDEDGEQFETAEQHRGG